MSSSFFDSPEFDKIKNKILSLNLSNTFDSSYNGGDSDNSESRGKFTSIELQNQNIIDQPRVTDLQEAYSINLLRYNKYGADATGYERVDLDSNPVTYKDNENKLDYSNYIQPFIGEEISKQGNQIVDIKTLILNKQLDSYKDTKLGVSSAKSLEKLINENISSNIDRSSLNRWNNDPLSILKGNDVIQPDNSITVVNPNIKNPTSFLFAGVQTTLSYLGSTLPISPIPNSAFNIYSTNDNRKTPEDNTNANKFLSLLGIPQTDISTTESRMEQLLQYTGEGVKSALFDNLSNNTVQPGYEYTTALLKTRRLFNNQLNTISRNNNRASGLISNTKTINKLGGRGAYETSVDDPKSVLGKNGMVKIGPYASDNSTDFKKYMFSIENLAWADVPAAAMSEWEIGNGDPATGKRGRIMWFAPYGIKFDENSSAKWDSHDFLGRPEPVYTYNGSDRGGSLSFKIIVDHPSIINAARGNQSDIVEKYFKGEITIDDFYIKSTKQNENEKRALMKSMIGNVRRRLNIGTETPPDSNTIPLTDTLNGVDKSDQKPKSGYWSEIESSWFKELPLDENLDFKYIAEKIQYFHPGFHSTSPEGFNTRLTFLQQCLKQGPSITEGSKATGNLAFGRPPVCILRLGDFFYSKVIFESLSITYDNELWDLNPDGIGIQPLIADISLGVKIIGGSSLTGPVNRLQNAVSFNFYANTEIYDSRSDYWDKNTKGTKGYTLKKGLNLVNQTNKIDEQKANVGDQFKTPTPSGDQVSIQNKNLTTNPSNTQPNQSA